VYGPLGLVNHLSLLPRGSTLGPQAEHARKGNVIRSRDRYESGHDMTGEKERQSRQKTTPLKIKR